MTLETRYGKVLLTLIFSVFSFILSFIACSSWVTRRTSLFMIWNQIHKEVMIESTLRDQHKSICMEPLKMINCKRLHFIHYITLISLSKRRVLWTISSVDILRTSSPMPSFKIQYKNGCFSIAAVYKQTKPIFVCTSHKCFKQSFDPSSCNQ